jgi:peptidoglycan/LPS O-acetylase OafA/YrhL
MLFVVGMLALLLVPFFAMQFGVQGWDWDGTDFTIMAVILSLAGVGLAIATNSQISRQKRLIGLGVVGFLFILYVHLAVGIVDSGRLRGLDY